LRQHTKIFQNLLNEIQELLEKFYQFVINLKIEKSYKLKNIFNIDKTFIWFDIASNFIINSKGDKTVHIHLMSNEKN